MSAEIVPFPARRTRISAISAAPAPQEAARERLRIALERLHDASNNQRQAVGNWRQALSNLQASMETLEERLQRTRDRLDNLQQDITVLHDNSRRLERWATDAERQDRATPAG